MAKKLERNKIQKHERDLDNRLKMTTDYIKQECDKRYGFHANPLEPKWKNKIAALTSMDTSLLVGKQPNNLAFHNLDGTSLPAGANELLGLGLKFCVQRPTPKPEIRDTISKLTRSIRIRHYTMNQPERNEESDYIPSLYLNTSWIPPRAGEMVEKGILAFEHEIEKQLENRIPNRQSNLTYYQQRALKELRSRVDIHVCDSDKNLGPTTSNKTQYMTQMYKEHLNTEAYRRLSEKEAVDINTETHKMIRKLFHEKCGLAKAECTYLSRSFKLQKRIHQMYGGPKLHKTPLKWRPIVSCVGGVTEHISKWIDHHLKRIIKTTPTFLRDSQQVVMELKAIGQLPPHARLFTSDATAMYTNIEPGVGITAIKEWIETTNDLPEKFPTNLILKALDIVMNRNVFQFDDTYWRQYVGTAMGTPCACSYATLSYAFHELHKVLPFFVNSLSYFKRFIDDMLGIWTGQTEEEWIRFKNSLNGFGKLTWITSERTKEVIFLDLRISINDEGYIETTTYQKDLNLHLYIPGLSAHPDGCLKGTIFGNAIRYWHQNSHIQNFTKLMSEFATHLQNRGHAMNLIEKIMMEAADRIDSGEMSNSCKKRNTDMKQTTHTLYVHWQYHPCDITKTAIRNAYDKTLMGIDGFDNMTVCFSRPQNLRDLLTCSVLKGEGKQKMSEIIKREPSNQER
jgi:hypothetical protein